MKKLFLLLLLALAAGCEKHDPNTDEVEVETQGSNRDCGKAQVVVKDPARVAQLIGSPIGGGATYLALNLDTALWVRKNQALLLRIRRPTAEEGSFICHAMGPAYPALTVVSARVK
ncbi:hypothetical protein [Hymenobacter sp. BRD67]|uniref:hypothetical protein n=1 Tax=Hymenobacter sp. BRD67 TaxID=2675877 RepID=UPI001564C7D6|nr:hypothetical protein [Hymenobacter sp. BRD67]QKG52750.1 hypothetical protein GKZ67_09240 [Hymenobacter sp. BRD67]